jgi:hypothetical protein
MTDPSSAVLTGAVAMASFVAALFFLRFWQQTRDVFFIFFAVAFGIDAAARFALGITQGFYYQMRLLTFCLIIIAIAHKNKFFRK